MKSLAKDTAIYGLSSIVGRFLNYLLVPLYTTQLSASSGGYGVITNMYAYTALILVLLTFGMETTFFRFANKEGEDPQKVYSTILNAVGFTALVFIALVFTFITPLSNVMGYAARQRHRFRLQENSLALGCKETPWLSAVRKRPERATCT